MARLAGRKKYLWKCWSLQLFDEHCTYRIDKELSGLELKDLQFANTLGTTIDLTESSVLTQQTSAKNAESSACGIAQTFDAASIGPTVNF